MDINQIKKFVDYIVRKNNSSYLNPDQFNQVMDRAQISKFMELYGNPKEYQPGNPIPRIAYEVTQKISDDLRAFKENSSPILDKNGRFEFPDDYIHTISLAAIIGKNKGDGTSERQYTTLDIVPEDKEYYRLSSVIVPPTKQYPIAVVKNTYMQVYPVDMGGIQFSYLRRPVAPVWGYDIVNGRPVYNESKSTNLEWPEQTINDIVIRACNFIGISIKDIQILNYTQGKTQEGL